MSKDKKASRELQNSEFLFQIYIKEYEKLRDEYTTILNHQNQLINYGIAIVVGVIALFSIELSQVLERFPWLLLIAALMMISIFWALLETYFRNRGIGICIQFELKPKIEKLLSNKKNVPPPIFVRYKTGHFDLFFVFQNMYALGKMAIALIPSIAFLVLFNLIKGDKPWEEYEKIIFVIAILAIILTVITAIINYIGIRKRRMED